jgi:hypothetical protein
MSKKVKYGTNDLGCWADGTRGLYHVRSVLANLIEDSFPIRQRRLITELRYNAPSDGAFEEFQALTLLNNLCENGIEFVFIDGDLVLARNNVLES